MILDGWGTSPDPKVSAIDHAKTPFIDGLYTNYAHASLRTDGLHVGLPEGQMGNSEVGHMNLGAGRIVYQDLAKINLAVSNKTLGEEGVLKQAMAYAKTKNKPIHLLGLLSDGGVHSHINHLFGLLDTLEENDIDKAYVHAFTRFKRFRMLAPMEDVSDPPFRALCKEQGADVVYTEFISSEGLVPTLNTSLAS